jgi:alpha-tubulin suppressor-like RCC1 family protein
MFLMDLPWQARGLLLKAIVGGLMFFGVEGEIFSQTMAGGKAHTLFVDSSGQLWAWGANNAGQLGDVTKDQTQRLKPLRIGAETDWEKVYADGDTSYAIKKEGSLWAWGDGSLGQLGDGTITSRTSPVRIGGTTLWDQLSARDGAVLGIRRDGTLWAWGKNVNGTLGLGRGRLLIQNQPAKVGSGLWKSVAVGNYYRGETGAEVWSRSFGVDQAGKMWTWGQDPQRSSSFTDYILFAPRKIDDSKSWSKVDSAGTDLNGSTYDLPVAVALLGEENGTVWQWNGASQTFREITNSTYTNWVNIVWADIRCGRGHVVARDKNGALWSWGNNDKRQLGRLGEPPRPGIYNWALLSSLTTNVAGDGSGLAEGAIRLPDTSQFSITYEGDVATGSQAGQFGTNYWSGSAYTIERPFRLLNPPDSSDIIFFRSIPGTINKIVFEDVDPGTRSGVIRPVLAFSSLGSVIKNEDGEVVGTNNVTLKFDRSFHIISSGPGHDNVESSFEMTSDKTLVGGGGHGVIEFYADEGKPFSIEWEVDSSEEGLNEVTGVTVGIIQTENLSYKADRPEQVGTSSLWGEIGAGQDHTLGIENGKLKAWGDNSSGQCGGVEILEKLEPKPLGVDRDWDRVLPGKDFVVAHKQDGSLWAWGNAEATNRETSSAIYQDPVQIFGENDQATTGWSREIAALESSASNNIGKRIFGLKNDGTLAGWGGRDGLNSYDSLIRLPWWDRRQDTFGTMPWTWQGLAGNLGKGDDSHVLAVRSDGTLWAWGANTGGQLGDGTKVSKDLPNQIGVRTNWMKAFAGGSHSLALRSDGTLWAWGLNTYGQLGAVRMKTFYETIETTNTNQPSFQNSYQKAVAVSDQVRPIQVGTSKNWLTLSAGGQHNLALKKDRSLWVWGDHSKGQLGLGSVAPATTETNTNSATVFSPARLGSAFWTDVSAGLDHSLGVRSDGTLWAWGNNEAGQLGDGTRVEKKTPVQIGAANNWKKVWAGNAGSFAQKNDGSLFRWGDSTNENSGLEKIVEEPAEVSFSQLGLGSLVLREGGQAVGFGIVSFQPASRMADLSVQLGLEPGSRIHFTGSKFEGGKNTIQLPRLSGLLAGQTNYLNFSEFKRKASTPQSTYAGTAYWSNRTYKASLVVGGDRDGDGFPDETDKLPDGPLPNVVSPTRVKGRVDEAFEYQITSTVEAKEFFFESDLPAGLEFLPNGKINGTPTEVGRHSLVVGVESVSGTDYQLIDLRIIPRRPIITSPTTLEWSPGLESFAFRVTATETNHLDYPIRFRASGLPRGLVLNAKDGKIRPANWNNLQVPAPGIYRVALSARNSEDQGSAELLLISGSGNWEAGQPVDYRISLGAGQSGRYVAQGLPPGLTIHPRTGRIRGTPLQAGASTVTVTFSGRRGSYTKQFQMAVEPASDSVALSRRAIAKESVEYPAIFSPGRLMQEIVQVDGTVKKPKDSAFVEYAVQWEDVDRWEWNEASPGLATGLSSREILKRRSLRAELKSVHPEAKVLAGISFAQAEIGLYLPDSQSWWLRDSTGAVLSSLPGSSRGLLDFSSHDFVVRLAQRVKSLMDTGCVDGVYLKGWDAESVWPAGSVPQRGIAGYPQEPARLELLGALRQAVGGGWIVAEVGEGENGVGLAELDGVHLVASTEAPLNWPPADDWNPVPYSGSGFNSWSRIEESLLAFGRKGILRKPGSVFLECWSRYGRLDPRNLQARVTGLAMSLCLSDGGYLFSEPDWWQENKGPINPEQHAWYPEWNKILGKAINARQSAPNSEGVYMREFENGWAVFQPAVQRKSGAVDLSEEARSVRNGNKGTSFILLPGEGDLFVKTNRSQD